MDTSTSNLETPVATSVNIPSEAAIQSYVRIVTSQTDMSQEDALDALKQNEYNVVKVIRAYMKGDSNSKSTTDDLPKSTNQLRFNEIRKFMDTASETYRRNKEISKIYEQMAERRKQIIAQQNALRAAAAAAEASKKSPGAELPPISETENETES
jgi:hypothetical protein